MTMLVQRKKTETIHTIPTNRQYRVSRVKTDLDRSLTENLTQEQAINHNLAYIDLYGFPIDSSIISIIPKEIFLETRLGVFALLNKELHLITDNPNHAGQDVVLANLADRDYTFKMYYGSNLSMDKLHRTFDQLIEVSEFEDEINLTTEEVAEIKKQGFDLKILSERLRKANTTEILDIVFAAAMLNGATDIHFEPEETSYKMRLRLDGILYTLVEINKNLQKPVESRIKLLAKVKLNLDNIAQDGRITFGYEKKVIDVRVSFLPSNYGYSIVMRLLGTGAVTLTLDALGFQGQAKIDIERAINKPQGMILTTGPTGSGKTTTLYTILKTLNDGSSKIITLEDPIEYRLEGLSQTQIDAPAGYTFASGLRSILRQDPDIVMVGEIRDPETADTAIQAALTGHQVLSTIHTNDAAGAIPRLIELGIRGFAISDAVSVILGQRLVRKLCPHCKTLDQITDEQKAIIIRELSILLPSVQQALPNPLTFWTATGCDKCNDTGYKGRVGVYEVLTINDEIRETLLSSSPSTTFIRQLAARGGMLSMLQDGIVKALQGITDMKEVLDNIQS